MKKTRMTVLCAVLSGSLLCTSCIGSFGLWNNLKDWNQSIHLIPVYEVAYIADVIVLNSVEFWSGSNPLADVGKVKTVKGENGEYMVRTNEDGYTITKKGEEDKPLDLVYNAENRTWNAVTSEGESYELITMNEDGTITFKQADGTPMTVSPDLQGLATARAASGQSLFLAAR